MPMIPVGGSHGPQLNNQPFGSSLKTGVCSGLILSSSLSRSEERGLGAVEGSNTKKGETYAKLSQTLHTPRLGRCIH